MLLSVFYSDFLTIKTPIGQHVFLQAEKPSYYLIEATSLPRPIHHAHNFPVNFEMIRPTEKLNL